MDTKIKFKCTHCGRNKLRERFKLTTTHDCRVVGIGVNIDDGKPALAYEGNLDSQPIKENIDTEYFYCADCLVILHTPAGSIVSTVEELYAWLKEHQE